MPSPLIITADIVDQGVLVIPYGEIDFTTARQLREVAASAINSNVSRNVIIDLRKTIILDSAGLGALMQARKVAGQNDIDFYTLVTPGFPPDRLLASTNLNTYLNVIYDLDGVLPTR